MKKIFRLVFCSLALLFCFTFLASCAEDFKINIAPQIKNVIILIGDGMGFNHIENAKTFFEVDEFDFEKNKVCNVTTYSKDNATTDSAAAATALATGVKVNNGNVSMYDGEKIENIMEIAHKNNKKTGIITSDKLYGATPACFSSHANNRADNADIIAGQLTSRIDVLIGQKSTTYANNQTAFENAGYTFASSVEAVLECNKNQKVLANIENLRSTYNNTLQNQADFTQLVTHTLNILDNENGFCLMIENAYIDKCSHSNDVYGAVCEVRSFADTIQTVYNFCKNRNDTVVIITADHETGGLAKGNNKQEITNSLYTTTSHTAANVPLYLTGCKISGFKNEIDNTQIFDICKKALFR